MKLDSLAKCLVATPVMHLPRVAEFLNQRNSFFEVDETISYDSLSSLLKKRSDIKSIFINPNAQGFYIDKYLLSNTFLRCVNTCSTGTNHIDKAACAELGIELLSLTKDYSLINDLPSTSELAFGMMISLFRNFQQCHEYVIKENWNYKEVMGHQISGSSIGVLGYGRLGKIFCNQLEGFGVNILVCEESSDVFVPDKYQRVDIANLFKRSDAVIVHIHSSPKNIGLINKNILRLAKQGMYLINTSRGDLVDEGCIAELIQSHQLGGYATDVLATEFTDISDSPILKLCKQSKYNIVITPHVGGMTFEGQEKAFLYALNKFKIS